MWWVRGNAHRRTWNVAEVVRILRASCGDLTANAQSVVSRRVDRVGKRRLIKFDALQALTR